jgi:hypothetical protein
MSEPCGAVARSDILSVFLLCHVCVWVYLQFNVLACLSRRVKVSAAYPVMSGVIHSGSQPSLKRCHVSHENSNNLVTATTSQDERQAATFYAFGLCIVGKDTPPSVCGRNPADYSGGETPVTARPRGTVDLQRSFREIVMRHCLGHREARPYQCICSVSCDDIKQ